MHENATSSFNSRSLAVRPPDTLRHLFPPRHGRRTSATGKHPVNGSS